MDMPPKEKWSTRITGNDGKLREFPALDDYTNHLAEQGHIHYSDELRDPARAREHWSIVRDIQRHWLYQGQIGCLFAKRLAKAAQEESWFDLVVYSPFDTEQQDRLEARVGELDKFGGAVQIICPTITTPREVWELLRSLSSRESWHMERIETRSSTPEILNVGLRWHLNDGKYISWILGLAPFSTMPFTRQSPFVALFIRTQGPGPCPRIAQAKRPPKDAKVGKHSVHLADLQFFGNKKKQVRTTWAGTVSHKQALMAGDPKAGSAKAKVTFALPENSCENNLDAFTD